MKPKYCNKQDRHELTGRYSFRFSKAASLGLAGIISTLFTGCAYNSELSSAVMPTIKPIYIVRSSETADSYYTLGKYYFWQNRFDKAQEAFQQALKLHPNSVDALNGLGASYDRLGQFEAAQRSYRLALDVAPESAYIWANLGYSMLLQGRGVTAVAVLEKAIKLDPANSMARRHLALATEAAANVAASSPEGGQALPVVASTTYPPEEPAAAETKSKPSTLAEESKPAGNAIIAIIPHESVKHSDVIQDVSPVRNASPVTVQSKSNVTAIASHAEIPARSAAMATPSASPAASHLSRSSYVLTVSMKAAVHNFDRTRVEISNGNGVNGMARALRTVMKSEGVNVTRVTNAIPFNKTRTVIICADEKKETAQAIARLLPGNPSVTIASTAYRNVEIRVVLGADAALAWNNSKKVNVAALY